jgi:signal transduction histidine kinase
VLPPERWPLYRALAGRETVREELLVRRGQGELVPVATGAAPVLDASGGLSGAIVIVHDISARKELERLREEWAAIVAHDLRQPVSTIRMSVEAMLLDASELPAGARHVLERIESATRRLSRMIADLLDVSRLDSNRLAVERRPVEIDALIGSVLDGLGETLAGHRVLLAVTHQLVSIDPDRIHQVLANLVSNAVKYGSPRTDVAIEARPCAEGLEIVVTNEGPGIPADELPHVFDRFRRARGSRGPGVGLGLYIAKGLVAAHGGRIWAESTPGEKTSFHFTLPAVAHQCEEPALHS